MELFIKILLTLLDCVVLIPMLGLIFVAKDCWDVNDISNFVMGVVSAVIVLVSFIVILICIWAII